MAKDYRNIKGLLETIELQRPSDALPGETIQKVGLSLYPRSVDHLNNLQTASGIATRSQLVRAVLDFVDKNQSDFVKFLEESAELKAG
jgi:hypothetical protein